LQLISCLLALLTVILFPLECSSRTTKKEINLLTKCEVDQSNFSHWSKILNSEVKTLKSIIKKKTDISLIKNIKVCIVFNNNTPGAIIFNDTAKIKVSINFLKASAEIIDFFAILTLSNDLKPKIVKNYELFSNLLINQIYYPSKIISLSSLGILSSSDLKKINKIRKRKDYKEFINLHQSSLWRFILSHEIGHIVNKNIDNRTDLEKESDIFALRLASYYGISPLSITSMFLSLSQSELSRLHFCSTGGREVINDIGIVLESCANNSAHPSSSDRIKNISNYILNPYNKFKVTKDFGKNLNLEGIEKSMNQLKNSLHEESNQQINWTHNDWIHHYEKNLIKYWDSSEIKDGKRIGNYDYLIGIFRAGLFLEIATHSQKERKEKFKLLKSSFTAYKWVFKYMPNWTHEWNSSAISLMSLAFSDYSFNKNSNALCYAKTISEEAITSKHVFYNSLKSKIENQINTDNIICNKPKTDN